MKRRTTLLVFLGIAGVATALGTGVSSFLESGKRAAAGPGRPPVRVTVPPGASAAAVGQSLERQGVIRSAFVWERFIAGKAKIRPGIYDLSPSEAPAQILRRLEKGDIATNRVTFPEGFTVQKIARRLKERGLIADEKAFLELATRRGDTLTASFSPPANLEGYLFPATYRFPVGASDLQIAQRMLDNFDRRVARGLAKRIDASGRTLEEIVIVASLIEREAETEADRPKIAAVIYNRLARKMRLEIDATVQYARGQHVARLLYRDLKIDSPYNTYRVLGLPPGAICCPGLPSIQAALAPERSDFLYYVARSDGSHVFAKTFAEHRRNIALVRRRPVGAGRRTR